MQNIFISYRRKDAEDVTGRITDVLKSKFGKDRLFRDVDSIALGSDLRRVIADAVGNCNVLLAIIGDDWLDAKADDGASRRIDDPDDFVHIEIRAALERNIPVIPVLVERTNMPRDKDLPEPLRPLAFRNGISVRPDPDFHNDMMRLCQALGRELKQKCSWTALAAGIAGVLMLALGASAFYFLSPAGNNGKPDWGDQRVQLREPEDNSPALGFLQLRWSAEGLRADNLDFDVELRMEDGKTITQQADGFLMDSPRVRGRVEWRVRPVWNRNSPRQRQGAWSPIRVLTYYATSLDRIVATGTICVGRSEGGDINDYETTLLRLIGKEILKEHRAPGEIKIVKKITKWDKLLEMLKSDADKDVDLVASGISITAERERDHNIRFSRPILQYPQTIVTRSGVTPWKDGQLAIGTLGYTKTKFVTTNETLTERLLDRGGPCRLVPYKGDGTYGRMLADVSKGTIDGAILDKPDAMKKSAA